MTNMLSSGFHSPWDEFDRDPLPFVEVEVEVEERVGSWGTKAPSSRSLSYTMTVPSACATRKRVWEEGTQRTAVHRESVTRPYNDQTSINERSDRIGGAGRRTCLFNLQYLFEIGSVCRQEV